MKKILIVKHGALGDVVRTSYFAGALRRKYGEELHLSWITAPAALPLISCNPHINLATTLFADLESIEFDVIYSLDDELNVVHEVSKLNSITIVGSYFDGDLLSYSDDSSEWFNMGLLSKFGKVLADQLKRQNTRGHAEIFKDIFDVQSVKPEFYLSNEDRSIAQKFLEGRDRLLGINPYAGGRWPSKEIGDDELFQLIKAISEREVFSELITIVLFGANNDRFRNEALAKLIKIAFPNQEIIVANTDDSVMKLAAYISRMSLMISSDSLGMHLAISQGIPTLAFFAPTSASEIDSFGICEKLLSTASDYCSYAKNCDNSSITADRLINKISAMNLNNYSLITVRN
jgi:heptosyltransferase-2